MRALFDNRKKDTSGQLLTMGRSGSSISNTLCRGPDKNGWAENSDRMPYVEYAESAVPSSRRMNQGLAFTQDGALYITGDAVTSTSNKVNGIAIRADGALHVAPAGSTATLKSNGMGITASGQVIMAESFVLPLNTSVVPLIGTGSATYTRATVATVFDNESVLRNVSSGEARFQGARRVQNLLGAVGNASESLATFTASGAIKTANTITFAGSGEYIRSNDSGLGTGVRGRTFLFTADVSSATGAVDFRLMINESGVATRASSDITAPVTPTRYSFSYTFGASATECFVGWIGSISSNRGTITVDNFQWEDVTGQSNQAPAEYVSVGVLSTPFHGAGVDGVKYFSTTNGNSVASNVVTEASGSPISASTLLGYLAEAAGTQLVTPTASIRDMTNAAWVKGATMTAALTGTGIDGVANSCSSLTGGAVAATNTAFQTLVAAASSRTYSCFIKRVTGTGTINITQNGGTGYTDITSQINSSTFTRVSLNASVLNAAFGIQIVTSGDVILVDFNQFESGAFATSPMASAGAARNIDVLTYPSSGNVLGTVGSAYAETTYATATVGPRFISTLSSGNGIPLWMTALKVSIRDNTTAREGVTPPVTSPTTPRKFASSWGVSCFTADNGSVSSALTFSGNLNLGPTMAIGGDTGGANLFGTIRNVRIYSAQLSAAQLSAVTV